MSSCRPTGRLDPNPAALAYAPLELAALESRARQGEIILLYEAETRVWRFALPRRGWWRRAQRYRLPTRPLRPGQSKREEALKRQAWPPYRAWSRMTSGVFLHIIGAVQYGTSRVIYTLGPPFDAHACRPYLHQVMGIFGHTGKAVVMVADQSGLHRAHTLASTLTHSAGKLHLHLFPPRCGHHLNPIEGFGRAMKDASGAGRCLSNVPQLDKRTRQVRMAHCVFR